MNDPINTPNDELREVLDTPAQMELRGYELARALNGGGWEVVNKYRPNDKALALAEADGAFLQRRHPGETYRVRPIVSLDIAALIANRTAE